MMNLLRYTLLAISISSLIFLLICAWIYNAVLGALLTFGISLLTFIFLSEEVDGGKCL